MFYGRNTEYQIGRGEVAESRVEVPVFVIFMLVCASLLFIFQLTFHRAELTLALAVTMIVLGTTVLKVEWGVYVLIIAMLLSPEINTGNVGGRDRTLNIRYDDILVIAIFFGVLVRLAWEGRFQLWRPSPINPGIFLYYSVCIFSTLLAVGRDLPYWDKETAFFVMVKMAEFYMVFFLVGNAVNSIKTIRTCLVLFFIVSVIIAVYGMVQVGRVDRVSAPFETGGTEPNTLGGYQMIVMTLAAALFLHAPGRGIRIVTGLLFVTTFLPFLYTLSRASYLALIASMLVLGFMTRSKGLVVVVLAALMISPFVMPEEVKDRVNSTFQRGYGKEVKIAGRDTGLQVDKSTHERIYVWQKVTYNLRWLPWYGGGVAWGTVLDSQYARVLIETGIAGFLAFVFMQYRILKTTREGYRWTGNWLAKAVAVASFAITIGLIVHSMGTISFLIVRIMGPFWFLVAVSVVIRDLAIEDYVRKRNAAPEPVAETRQPDGRVPGRQIAAAPLAR